MGHDVDGAAGARQPDFLLRMRFDPVDGIVDLEPHLASLKTDAQASGVAVDRHAVRNELHAATFRLTGDTLIRVRISSAGATAIEATPLPPRPAEPVTVGLVTLPLPSGDPDPARAPGDDAAREAARAASGRWEVLFARSDGGITGGSFTSLFVPEGDRLRTPPHGRGVLRETLLASGEAAVGRVSVADLARGFFLGDPVYGLVAAMLG